MEAAAIGWPVRCASAAARWSCQIAEIPSRAKIDKASFSERVREQVIGQLRAACFGVAIDLVSRGSQTGNTVAVDVPLPGQELINREIVQPTHLIDRNPAASHGLDHGGLAP